MTARLPILSRRTGLLPTSPGGKLDVATRIYVLKIGNSNRHDRDRTRTFRRLVRRLQRALQSADMIETLSSIEPLLFEDEVPRRLADLVCQIQQEVAWLERGLPADTLREMADLATDTTAVLRSNLIDDAVLHRACEEPLEREEPADAKAPSAAEAEAEASVLGAIDAAHAAGTLASPTSVAFLTWAHRSFYQALAVSNGRVPDQGSLSQHPGGWEGSKRVASVTRRRRGSSPPGSFRTALRGGRVLAERSHHRGGGGPSQAQPHPAVPLWQRAHQPPDVARHGDARRHRRRRALVDLTRIGPGARRLPPHDASGRTPPHGRS